MILTLPLSELRLKVVRNKVFRYDGFEWVASNMTLDEMQRLMHEEFKADEKRMKEIASKARRMARLEALKEIR